MAIAIFAIYIAVVIDEVFVSCVVRGIYIDDINFALVRICKRSERFKIIAFYD